MLLTLVLTLFFLVLELCEQNSLCRLKTYSVPCTPSTYCSHIEVSISVNEIENEESDFNITLIAYNMDPSSNHQVSFKLNGQTMTLEYICLKLELGETSAFVNDSQKWLMTGSSIYMNGNLICTWIVEPFSVTPSLYDSQVLELMYNANYSLTLGLDEKDSEVAQNSTEIPWYQLSFTKCGGYKIYGNDEYQLIIKKVMDTVHFWVKAPQRTAKSVRVAFSHQNGSYLFLTCNYLDKRKVYGFSRSYDGTVKKPNHDPKFDRRILGDLCSIVMPDTFDCKMRLCFIWNSTFDLYIEADNDIIYALKNLNLSESNSGGKKVKSISKDITIVLSFIIVAMVNC